MSLDWRTKRSLGIVIPLFTGFLFWGWINGIFGVGAMTNIANTGITIGFIMGVLNLWLAYMIFKHRIG